MAQPRDLAVKIRHFSDTEVLPFETTWGRDVRVILEKLAEMLEDREDVEKVRYDVGHVDGYALAYRELVVVKPKKEGE